MKRTPIGSAKRKPVQIRRISERRKTELVIYRGLESKLRVLCRNRSELSDNWADWQTHWNVEGHHITGRNGKRLLDPFNLILLTRAEHDTIWKYSKEELLLLVKGLRIKQGFKEVNNERD